MNGDASQSFILAREAAQHQFTQVLPADDTARLVVYLPYPTPTDNQARIKDPFFILGLSGTVFPYGPTDRYAELCKACYPGQETRIDTLFKEGDPTFETIDALSDGHTYALLQTLTGGKSDQEILLKLLTASEDKAAVWQKQKGMPAEWKSFAKQLLGLKTTSSTLPDVQTELWRFVLFSEFVYDLPVELPKSFLAIPCGSDVQKRLILDVCDTLRKHRDWATLYVERAEAVDAELGLSEQFATATDLGEIITFSFEDNTFFHRFLNDVLNNQPEQATKNLASVQGNIWEGHDPQRTANWQVARCGAELLTFAGNLSDTHIRSYKTLATLTDQYATDWYRFDQFQRSFETFADALPDHSDLVDTYIRHVRQVYRQRSEALQKHYQSLVQAEGWPGSIPVQNTQVFAKQVEPHLKANSPTAYIWADAFRFELGKEVAAALAKNGHSVDIVPSAAYIPTVTKLAMAALLPEADKKLVLRQVGDSLEAELDGVVLKNLQDRVSVLQARFGDRMKHQSVDTFLSSPKSKPIDLLCLSFAEMDTAGESLASNALLPIQEAGKN